MEATGANNTPLGLIVGSNKVDLDKFDAFNPSTIDTPHGPAYFLVAIKQQLVILPRHGKESNIPPHMINHRANILGFQKLEVKDIISFTSVGSLHPELKPSHLIIPDDYINLGKIPTYFDTMIKHIVPSLATKLRNHLIDKIKQLQTTSRFTGTYIQTTGPRLETKAEIQMLKMFGDVVGMTMAAEATLAKELEIDYANVSVIDNFCHGLLDEPLNLETLSENQAKNAENIERIIQTLL
jgi:5'-methylthioadenosine phosphorylase